MVISIDMYTWKGNVSLASIPRKRATNSYWLLEQRELSSLSEMYILMADERRVLSFENIYTQQ